MMNETITPQPDIRLLLDTKGVITDATLASGLVGEDLGDWIGRRWADTVDDIGGDKVSRIIDEAMSGRVAAFRQVNQLFPSGIVLPIEYTTVRVDDQNGLIAIGKNLQAIAEIQAQLVSAQQAIEHDYWKLREVETRYQLVLEGSSDAVLLLRASNNSVLEANPAAIQALGLGPDDADEIVGRDIFRHVRQDEREPLKAMLNIVRNEGKAPGVVVHLGSEGRPWFLRAAITSSRPWQTFLLQLNSTGFTRREASPAFSVEQLMRRVPDGFVVLDHDGRILQTNEAFLELAQVGAEGGVIGERIGKWLGRPGADLAVLLTNLGKYGVIRLFPTTIQGELGASTEVEISAIGNRDTHPQFIGMILRDVSRRLTTTEAAERARPELEPLTRSVGKTPLLKLVRDTVDIVEKRYLEEALLLTDGNRTAAAELLGLSRQSLYAKLNRYGVEQNAATSRTKS